MEAVRPVVDTAVVVVAAVAQSQALELRLAVEVPDSDSCIVPRLSFCHACQFVAWVFVVAGRIAAAAVVAAEEIVFVAVAGTWLVVGIEAIALGCVAAVAVEETVFVVAAGIRVVGEIEAFVLGWVAAESAPAAGSEAGHIENWETRREIAQLDSLAEVAPAVALAVSGWGCSAVVSFAVASCRRGLVAGTAAAA